MEKLTKQQILTICNNVISKLKKAQSEGDHLFLCNAIKTEIQNIEYCERYEIDIVKLIPEFTKLNAVIMAEADKECDRGVWWYGKEFDYANRIKFMQFIIECQNNK
jgi:hypothetical protein